MTKHAEKPKRSKLQLEVLALAALNHRAVSVTVRRLSPPDRNWNWELASIQPVPSADTPATIARDADCSPLRPFGHDAGRTGSCRSRFSRLPARRALPTFDAVPGVARSPRDFRATIDRPDRFRRSRDVGAHLGLTPAHYQSGETDISGKISRCGDELARTALYEAAHTLLVRSRKGPACGWGMKIRQGAPHGVGPRRGRPQARRVTENLRERKPSIGSASHSAPRLAAVSQDGTQPHALRGRANSTLPVGTIGAGISLRGESLRVTARSWTD